MYDITVYLGFANGFLIFIQWHQYFNTLMYEIISQNSFLRYTKISLKYCLNCSVVSNTGPYL